MLRDGSIEAGSGVVGTGWMGVEREPDHGGRCDQLHRTLKRIVKARGSLDLQEAAALREAQNIQLWRRFGYASLVEYLELEMGYSPRAALERLRVANALPQLPQIAAAIEQGDLSFSGARELTRVATPETEQNWLGATAEMNLREVEAAVSGHTRGDLPTDPPDPKLQRKVLRYEVRPETDVRLREAKRKLEKQRGERVDDDAMLDAIALFYLTAGSSDWATDPRSCTSPDDESTDADSDTEVSTKDGTSTEERAIAGQQHRDDGAAPYRVAVTTCMDCKRGWVHGAGAEELMSPAAVERALCDAQEIGDLDAPTVERAKQTIPPAMRRKVKHRDKNRCRVPGCRCSSNIDIHHIVPREKGGTHTYENLISLCEAHHLALHEGAIAISIDAKTGAVTVKREGRNKFTRATRAVDAAKALRAAGGSKAEVRWAIERTKTHVGTTDLSLDQWIEIAKRYMP